MYQLMPILAILASLFTIIVVLELVRRAQLRAQYALLWLVGSVIILTISALYGATAALAKLLGVKDAPWLLLLTLGFLLALIIQGVNTLAISKLAKNNRDLAQRIAILEWYIRQLRKQVQRPTNAPTNQEQNQSLTGVDQLDSKKSVGAGAAAIKEERGEEELVQAI